MPTVFGEALQIAREIIAADHVEDRVDPGAVGYPLDFGNKIGVDAAGIDLATLARLANACGEVPALIAAYHAQVGPVPLNGLLTGLSLLVARHALVAEASTP